MDQKLIETLGDELYGALTSRQVVDPLTSRHPDTTMMIIRDWFANDDG